MRKLLAGILFGVLFLTVQPTFAQTHFNDVWVLDLETNTWSELILADPLPSPRRFMAHCYDYDSSRNRLVVFQGWSDPDVDTNSVWALDLTKGAEHWTELAVSGDIPTVSLTARGSAYDSLRDHFVVVYGSELRELDLSTNVWSIASTTYDPSTPPWPTVYTYNALVYDKANDRFILFAGGSGNDPADYTNRARSLDPNTMTWTELTFPGQALPQGRSMTGAAYDQLLQRMLVFGGMVPGGGGWGTSLDDTWQLTLVPGSETWTEFNTPMAPLDRAQHAVALDTKRGRMIIFGGLHYYGTTHAALNDVRAFDGSSWTNLWPSGTRPVQRRGAAAVYDPVNDRLVVFGGQQLPGSELCVDALVNVEPDTLNLKSQGQWVTCYITLPDGYDVSSIDVSTVGIITINQDEISPPLLADQEFGGEVGDYDNDGIPDITVKFNRQVLINLPLLIGDAGITIEGQLTTGEEFAGGDKIRVIRRGK